MYYWFAQWLIHYLMVSLYLTFLFLCFNLYICTVSSDNPIILWARLVVKQYDIYRCRHIPKCGIYTHTFQIAILLYWVTFSKTKRPIIQLRFASLCIKTVSGRIGFHALFLWGKYISSFIYRLVHTRNRNVRFIFSICKEAFVER